MLGPLTMKLCTLMCFGGEINCLLTVHHVSHPYLVFHSFYAILLQDILLRVFQLDLYVGTHLLFEWKSKLMCNHTINRVSCMRIMPHQATI